LARGNVKQTEAICHACVLAVLYSVECGTPIENCPRLERGDGIALAGILADVSCE